MKKEIKMCCLFNIYHQLIYVSNYFSFDFEKLLKYLLIAYKVNCCTKIIMKNIDR